MTDYGQEDHRQAPGDETGSEIGSQEIAEQAIDDMEEEDF